MTHLSHNVADTGLLIRKYRLAMHFCGPIAEDTLPTRPVEGPVAFLTGISAADQGVSRVTSAASCGLRWEDGLLPGISLRAAGLPPRVRRAAAVSASRTKAGEMAARLRLLQFRILHKDS